MFEIKIDTREFQKIKSQFPNRFNKACASVLRSESNRLRGVLKAAAESSTTPLAPMTPLLRKGQKQIGPFLSRFMSYDVDPRSLTSTIGILEGGKRPVRRGLAIMAKRQAKGYPIQVTRKAQQWIAKKIKARLGRITGRGAWGSYGGVLGFVPRYGRHWSKARAIVGPVYQRERARVIDNVRRNLLIKLSGGRYEA